MVKKTKRYDAGGDITVSGVRSPTAFGNLPDMRGLGGLGGVEYNLPAQQTVSRTAPTGTAGRMSFRPTLPAPQTSMGGVDVGGFRSPVGKLYGLKNVPVGGGALSVGANQYGNLGGRFTMPFKEGGKVKAKTKKMAKGGSTASKRADGCATKGKTKGRMV